MLAKLGGYLLSEIVCGWVVGRVCGAFTEGDGGHLLDFTWKDKLVCAPHRSEASRRVALRFEPSGAMLLLKNFSPASLGSPRLANVKDSSMGATMTLTFSSPELPGGPKAATGSATLRRCGLRGQKVAYFDLRNARNHLKFTSSSPQAPVKHKGS
jgi:hypothetical protein